uniref:Uncharacterized protein n=1 Tax=Rousettus aegyptiacus TaxID=9407 RepID=A0A7J8C2W5_ROUAE|nr:hypothetical protein HJG63_009469 [Rousettus aegyptiacus]
MGHSNSASHCTPPSLLPLPGPQAVSCPAVGASRTPGRPEPGPHGQGFPPRARPAGGPRPASPVPGFASVRCCPGFASPENAPASQSQVACGGRAYRRLHRHSHRSRNFAASFCSKFNMTPSRVGDTWHVAECFLDSAILSPAPVVNT